MRKILIIFILVLSCIFLGISVIYAQDDIEVIRTALTTNFSSLSSLGFFFHDISPFDDSIYNVFHDFFALEFQKCLNDFIMLSAAQGFPNGGKYSYNHAGIYFNLYFATFLSLNFGSLIYVILEYRKSTKCYDIGIKLPAEFEIKFYKYPFGLYVGFCSTITFFNDYVKRGKLEWNPQYILVFSLGIRVYDVENYYKRFISKEKEEENEND